MRQTICVLTLLAAAVFLYAQVAWAGEAPVDSVDDERHIPEEVTVGHWSCREVVELAKKYGATRKLPDPAVMEGKPCSRGELAECLLSVMEKVCDNCGKEGCPGISDDDREQLAALHDALKVELSRLKGYPEIRETIEKLLAPEQPPFLVKAGVNGFIRGEGAGNFRLPDFSYAPGHAEGRILYRIKPYVYWRPTDYLDIHIEGQGYGFNGSTQDFGRFNLYQGFVEAKLPGRDLLALKLGRQEFNYGSTFILGPNSFYDGLAFDAVRLRVKPLENLSLDLLSGYYATAFNNGMKGDLQGAYASYSFSDADAVEGYFFRDTGSPVHHPGEHRYIWGLRGTAKLGPVSLEFEPVYESGKVFNQVTLTNDNVSAYGGHADLTCEAELAGFHNKFIAGYAMGSGSRDAAKGASLGKEFKNPDNDTYQAGDISVIGDLSGINVGGRHASGLQIYTLGWGIDILKDLNFSAIGHYSLANGVEPGLSRRIGLETDFTATYTINDNLSLILGYDHFYTGGFFRGASGKEGGIDYGYALLQFDFSVTKLKPMRL